MSRNGGKHLGHKEQCKRYTNSGRCEVHRQQRIKRAADGKKEPSRKQPETTLMMWARIIKNCPKGGGHVDIVDGESVNYGWPEKYRHFGSLRKFQVNRVNNHRAKPQVAKKGVVANG